MQRKVLLRLLFLGLSVALLQYLTVMRNTLFVYDVFDIAGSQAKSSAFQQFIKSEQDQKLSDLREFESPLKDKREWMRNVLLSESSATFPKVGVASCSKIWKNDQEELNATRQYQHLHGREPAKNVRHYLQKTADCTSYLLKEGFRLATVDDIELSFPLAFSLIVYKDIEQVERLLRAVYRPHNVYCIHPEKMSSDDFHSTLRFIASCLPNVKVVERPLHVEWGKQSVLEADVECMRLLWRHPTKWRYFINLTGQEFPLKTNKEIVRILQTFKGANDISGTNNWMFNHRFENLLPAPHNLTISVGVVHIVASRGYVDYALHSRVARDFYKWVALTNIPDETFFSTLNHNPQLGVPGSYTGSLDNTTREAFHRYKVWMNRGLNPKVCDGKEVRGICHFGLGDLPRLVAAPQLFANKFSYDFMPLAYDCLEEWYWHKVYLENVGQAPELNLTRYQMSDTVLKRYDGPVKIWE